MSLSKPMPLSRNIKNWFKVRNFQDVIRLTFFFTIFTMLIPAATILFVSFSTFGELTPVNAGLLWIGILIPLFIVPPIGLGLLNMLRILGLSLKKLDAVVKIDPLTGVLTRTFFIASLQNTQQKTGIFLMADVDHFKSVNDNYGHHVGDMVLNKIAQSLTRSCGGNHMVGRLGGEEFGVFLEGYDLEDGVQMAWNICENVREYPISLDGVQLQTTISIGAALLEPDSKLEQTMKIADMCLYEAKNEGRNRVVSQKLVRMANKTRQAAKAHRTQSSTHTPVSGTISPELRHVESGAVNTV